MRFLISSAVALALLSSGAYAQTSRGTVTGSVLDPSGAVIPGAPVSLTSIATGVRLATNTNNTGAYRFDAVDLGSYEIRVVAPGFREYSGAGISVEANRTTIADAKVELAASFTSVDVSSETIGALTRDGPLRGRNFGTRDVRDLPLTVLNPLSLARTLSGVTDAAGSQVWGGGTSGVSGSGFSVNGQRPRGNNYMLDGSDNNQPWLTGQEQVFTIVDAVQEASVQTGHFGVEFGRASGGIFNVITKSGTNELHGTVLWRYQSQRLNTVSNLDRLNRIPKSVFSNHIYGFTTGGPIRRNKTFFFVGFQQNDRHSTANITMQVPTSATVSRLRSLFPANSRLDLYLSALGNLRGAAAPFSIALGRDPQTGADRGSAEFGAAAYVLRSINDGPQWLGRIDHYHSDAHRLSWRYTFDSRTILPATGGNAVTFPGFVQQSGFRHHNLLFTDSYNLAPNYTNEFRFSYGRPDTVSAATWPGSVPQALTLPAITIANISAPGLPSGNQVFYSAHAFSFQETQTKITGRHALRYGMEIVWQPITQARGTNHLGSISFTNAPAAGYSAFANFLDDFSGPSGNASRTFGAPKLTLNQFHQSYFFQDTWRATPALTLTAGLRYDNFGQIANALPYPAFAGFDPARFLARNEVNTDKNNFGPAVGFAWGPAFNNSRSGWLRRLLGDGKTVLRGGFQISYDTFFTQMVFLGPATTTPNAISTNAGPAPNIGRGLANWFAQIPSTASVPSPLDNQIAIDKDLRTPYTERWSLGFQRQMLQNSVFEISYVGSASHKLTTKADLNSLLSSGARLNPGFGPRDVRTSQGNSSYQALQTHLDRRFARGLQATAAYTWSKAVDSTSEGVGNSNLQQPDRQNRTSVPVSQGGLKLDRGVSDFDRPHRLSIVFLWTIPGPRARLWKYTLGGWSIAGVTTFQSGTPFSVANGSDRNNDGILADRADVGNPVAPLNSRAVLAQGCATGYRNPDSGTCVRPDEVRWLEGSGFPNASTVGRNTLRTGGTQNFDLNVTRSFSLGETRRLEFRWEALNAFNHPQFVNVPQTSVSGTPIGRFLNRDFTDAGIRSMWVQVKLLF